MKYKIAICDDMDQDVQYIASVVDEFCQLWNDGLRLQN